mgnify:CR=1 FL=1
MTKTCTKCGVEKPRSDFGVEKRTKDGRRAQCRACSRSEDCLYYSNNKDKFAAKDAAYYESDTGYWVRRKTAWRQIGILDVDTLSWEGLVESQQYKCKVCGALIDVYTAHRDHDHETGLTRAAVCGSKCNAAMDKISGT